jgi:DNA mismatch repair ATPase MutS
VTSFDLARAMLKDLVFSLPVHECINQSYFDQAIEIADLLKIRLTSKSMEGTRYPMCGFPIAQLDKFLEKLVRENNRFVAICEEEKHYDDNGSLKKITRKVVRVVTPGKSPLNSVALLTRF